jgi:serine/threonine-protein kinase RsbW
VTEQLRLRIPARAEYLVLCRLVLSGIARCRPIHPDDLSDLKLSLTEACTNSMRHAYSTAQGVVEIAYDLDDDSVAIEIEDDGPGFERASALSGGGLDEGGLGLAIIESLTDEIEIGSRRDGTGSRVRFRKKLAPFSDSEEP